MFESQSESQEDVHLYYTKNEDFSKLKHIPLHLWAEHLIKSDKERNKSLNKLFDNAVIKMKNLYCFLEEGQILGKVFDRFGIPNVCGQTTRKSLLSYSRTKSKKYGFEKVNKNKYKAPIAKRRNEKVNGNNKFDSKSHRYPPVAERWSDVAVRKFKMNVEPKKHTSQSYAFDDDESNINYLQIKNPVLKPCKDVDKGSSKGLNTNYRKGKIETHDFEKRREISEYTDDTYVKCSFVQENNDIQLLQTNTCKDDKNKKKEDCVLKPKELKELKKSVRFNDSDLCTFAPTQVSIESLSGTQEYDIKIFEDNETSKSGNGEIKTNTPILITPEHMQCTKELNGISLSPSNFNKVHDENGKFEIEPYYKDNFIIDESSSSLVSDVSKHTSEPKETDINLDTTYINASNREKKSMGIDMQKNSEEIVNVIDVGDIGKRNASCEALHKEQLSKIHNILKETDINLDTTYIDASNRRKKSMEIDMQKNSEEIVKVKDVGDIGKRNASCEALQKEQLSKIHYILKETDINLDTTYIDASNKGKKSMEIDMQNNSEEIVKVKDVGDIGKRNASCEALQKEQLSKIHNILKETDINLDTTYIDASNRRKKSMEIDMQKNSEEIVKVKDVGDIGKRNASCEALQKEQLSKIHYILKETDINLDTTYIDASNKGKKSMEIDMQNNSEEIVKVKDVGDIGKRNASCEALQKEQLSKIHNILKETRNCSQNIANNQLQVSKSLSTTGETQTQSINSTIHSENNIVINDSLEKTNQVNEYSDDEYIPLSPPNATVYITFETLIKSRLDGSSNANENCSNLNHHEMLSEKQHTTKDSVIDDDSNKILDLSPGLSDRDYVSICSEIDDEIQEENHDKVFVEPKFVTSIDKINMVNNDNNASLPTIGKFPLASEMELPITVNMSSIEVEDLFPIYYQLNKVNNHIPSAIREETPLPYAPGTISDILHTKESSGGTTFNEGKTLTCFKQLEFTPSTNKTQHESNNVAITNAPSKNNINSLTPSLSHELEIGLEGNEIQDALHSNDFKSRRVLFSHLNHSSPESRNENHHSIARNCIAKSSENIKAIKPDKERKGNPVEEHAKQSPPTPSTNKTQNEDNNVAITKTPLKNNMNSPTPPLSPELEIGLKGNEIQDAFHSNDLKSRRAFFSNLNDSSPESRNESQHSINRNCIAKSSENIKAIKPVKERKGNPVEHAKQSPPTPSTNKTQNEDKNVAITKTPSKNNMNSPTPSLSHELEIGLEGNEIQDAFHSNDFKSRRVLFSNLNHSSPENRNESQHSIDRNCIAKSSENIKAIKPVKERKGNTVEHAKQSTPTLSTNKTQNEDKNVAITKTPSKNNMNSPTPSLSHELEIGLEGNEIQDAFHSNDFKSRRALFSNLNHSSPESRNESQHSIDRNCIAKSSENIKAIKLVKESKGNTVEHAKQSLPTPSTNKTQNEDNNVAITKTPSKNNMNSPTPSLSHELEIGLEGNEIQDAFHSNDFKSRRVLFSNLNDSSPESRNESQHSIDRNCIAKSSENIKAIKPVKERKGNPVEHAKQSPPTPSTNKTQNEDKNVAITKTPSKNNMNSPTPSLSHELEIGLEGNEIQDAFHSNDFKSRRALFSNLNHSSPENRNESQHSIDRNCIAKSSENIKAIKPVKERKGNTVEHAKQSTPTPSTNKTQNEDKNVAITKTPSKNNMNSPTPSLSHELEIGLEGNEIQDALHSNNFKSRRVLFSNLNHSSPESRNESQHSIDRNCIAKSSENIKAIKPVKERKGNTVEHAENQSPPLKHLLGVVSQCKIKKYSTHGDHHFDTENECPNYVDLCLSQKPYRTTNRPIGLSSVLKISNSMSEKHFPFKRTTNLKNRDIENNKSLLNANDNFTERRTQRLTNAAKHHDLVSHNKQTFDPKPVNLIGPLVEPTIDETNTSSICNTNKRNKSKSYYTVIDKIKNKRKGTKDRCTNKPNNLYSNTEIEHNVDYLYSNSQTKNCSSDYARGFREEQKLDDLQSELNTPKNENSLNISCDSNNSSSQDSFYKKYKKRVFNEDSTCSDISKEDSDLITSDASSLINYYSNNKRSKIGKQGKSKYTQKRSSTNSTPWPNSFHNKELSTKRLKMGNNKNDLSSNDNLSYSYMMAGAGKSEESESHLNNGELNYSDYEVESPCENEENTMMERVYMSDSASEPDGSSFPTVSDAVSSLLTGVRDEIDDLFDD